MSHTQPGASYSCMYMYMYTHVQHLQLPHAVNTSPVISYIVCYRIDSLKIMYTIKYLNILERRRDHENWEIAGN